MQLRAPGGAPSLVSIALLGLAALSLGACQSAGRGAGSGLLGARMSMASPAGPAAARGEEDWRRAAASAGERYRASPSDTANAIRYAEALRRTGQSAQAAAVLQQASLANPHNREVLGAYGRALADAGRLEEALDVLGRAHTPEQPDWRVLSVQGAVLDQMGRHEEARSYYASALKIAPDEPSVLSNLALSYALAKDLGEAERTLRRANARGVADRRVRQNLALVVGLQGRFAEAEEIARAELPPDEAAANVAYLREMLAKHAGGVGGRTRGRPRAG